MSNAKTNEISDQFNGDNLLARLLNSSNDLVWCMSADGAKLLYVNTAAERIFGRPINELAKRKVWHNAVHKDDRSKFQTNPEELLSRGQVQQEYRIIRPNGEIRWLKEQIIVVPDCDGKPLQIGGIAADITESKRAVEELRKSEAIFHSLVENIPLKLIRKNLDGKIVFANQLYCDSMSARLEKLIGQSDFDLFPAELARKYTRDDRKVLESGEVLHQIEEHRTGDGSKIYVEVLKGPVLDVDKHVVGLQVMFWDVTDRKRAEAALDYERYLLHSLLDNVPDSIYFKDVDSRFIRCSRGLSEKFGLASPDEAIGKSDADFFSEEHAQLALADEQAVMRTGEPILGKEEKETWGGSEDTWCYTIKLPLRDPDGNTIGTFGISRDITNQKRAEAELARERDLLRTIINNVPDMIFVKDRAGRFITVNTALLNMLNKESVDEVIGKTDYDFSPPELACNYVADDQTTMRSGKPLLNQEERTRDPNGKEIWLLMTKVPLKNDEENVTGLVGIGRNITKRKLAEDELRAAKEAADTANRAKSDFLANMSHEIRTPMNAIIGMTELVLDTEINSNQREYLRMVRDSGDALLTVINDILDFSKIEAGKLELDPILFDIREDLGNTLRSLAPRAHAKNLELAFRVHNDVPNTLRGDIGRLRQVLINLVGNAIKFTEQGEVVVNVRSGAKADRDASLHISVQDTGIGISESKSEAIFDEFAQADSSTTRRYGGTGLGLAISSRLVELMGGRIWVESLLGRGSTFHFTVRMEESDSRVAQTAIPVVVGGTRVLIVDDNQTNRLILTEMVTNWGMLPIQVASVADARISLGMACQKGEPFHLILSDVNMPDADGFELAEQIRRDQSIAKTPIIMLTSGGRVGDTARREQLKIAANLMKPVKQSELFNAVVRVLGVNAAEKPKSDPADAAPIVSIRPLNILLAEDSIVNQKLALGLLSKHGHSITIANNGLEAVEASASTEFDLVLMDVQMPEMDGHDATRAIREREQKTGLHVPIIAMTAHAMPGDRDLCIESGMDEYISKPIKVKILFEKLAEVVGDREPTK